jgi:ubiquinone/menaquinone biosynthesis C-methylase UbiE
MTSNRSSIPTLKLMPASFYQGINSDDPIRFYYYPIFGRMYRHRVELCLNECNGGEKILEIGFGTGIAFINLAEKYKEIYGIDLTTDINKVSYIFKQIGLITHLKNGDILDLPYPDNNFDTVLLISILEHLHPADQPRAFSEISRVLKPGGQVVYGIPVERPFMVTMFKMLGYNIRKLHFSTEKNISDTALIILRKEKIVQMQAIPPWFGVVYEIGHFKKI